MAAGDIAYKNSMMSWQKCKKASNGGCRCVVWHYGWDERVMELDNLGGVKKAQAMYMKLDVVIVDGRANEEMMQ